MEPHRALQAEHLVSVSASARQLVDSLLLPEPGDRLTAEQALAQPWLTGYTALHRCLALHGPVQGGQGGGGGAGLPADLLDEGDAGQVRPLQCSDYTAPLLQTAVAPAVPRRDGRHQAGQQAAHLIHVTRLPVTDGC